MAVGQRKIDFYGAMCVDGITMTVAQSAKEIKVNTESKRNPPMNMPGGGVQPAAGGTSSVSGRRDPGRGMGRGFGMMGDGPVTYSLEGKETKIEMEGPNGKMPVVYKASLETDEASSFRIRERSWARTVRSPRHPKKRGSFRRTERPLP